MPMTVNRLDGYVSTITENADKSLTVVVTQTATGRSWTAMRNEIETILDVTSQIIADQLKETRQ